MEKCICVSVLYVLVLIELIELFLSIKHTDFKFCFRNINKFLVLTIWEEFLFLMVNLIAPFRWWLYAGWIMQPAPRVVFSRWLDLWFTPYGSRNQRLQSMQPALRVIIQEWKNPQGWDALIIQEWKILKAEMPWGLWIDCEFWGMRN